MLWAKRHARGLPPNVVPWSPVMMHLATSSETMVAPIGKPLPRAFAVVKMSGWAEGGSIPWAHSWPVRERPH